MVVDTGASGTFAEDRDAIRIPAERGDILVDPSDRLGLIFHALISRGHEILGAEESQRSEPAYKNLLSSSA